MNTKPINLIFDTIDKDDLEAISSWILTNPQLTKGPQTIEFEKEFAQYIGKKHAVFCNSGSSAILLMLYALIAGKKMKNKKVVVPSCSWATDLSSVIHLGLEPVLVDVNSFTLSVSIPELELIFKNENPSVLLLVSLLGIPPHKLDEIVTLCKKYGVILLGDHCESLGSSFDGEKLGCHELMACYSFYYSHTISTIEGGMIVTDDQELYEILKSIRSHGWTRDNSEEFKTKLKEQWSTTEFDSLYTFYYPGFNLRSTDIQAFIGRRQLKKLDHICKKRSDNYHLYKSLLKTDWLPKEPENSFVANFCFPIIHENRNEIVKELIENNIQCRPLVAGNLGIHPVYIERYGRKEFLNASKIHEHGFYVPNNDTMSEDDIKLICSIINKYCTSDDTEVE